VALPRSANIISVDSEGEGKAQKAPERVKTKVIDMEKERAEPSV